ncbi:hypothetical protein IC220_06420 [Wolbachia endosymbiont of Pentalonia nigronervosa]|jgi:hypothetical protein|uniref:hypothetical protein n=1 Tax=Wolbachia endosymbiont of Pentalonia nigronervosa TaxID=1301914 RepID=UPI00165F2E42|nr:hypothetical protein [Wolbachia endosymbiont of Pentalonia nigronervosa]MBD0392046.1 hypothetical protein [Wolbachia endosymbiont of Pentalonia nigronervosa]
MSEDLKQFIPACQSGDVETVNSLLKSIMELEEGEKLQLAMLKDAGKVFISDVKSGYKDPAYYLFKTAGELGEEGQELQSAMLEDVIKECISGVNNRNLMDEIFKVIEKLGIIPSKIVISHILLHNPETKMPNLKGELKEFWSHWSSPNKVGEVKKLVKRELEDFPLSFLPCNKQSPDINEVIVRNLTTEKDIDNFREALGMAKTIKSSVEKMLSWEKEDSSSSITPTAQGQEPSTNVKNDVEQSSHYNLRPLPSRTQLRTNLKGVSIKQNICKNEGPSL